MKYRISDRVERWSWDKFVDTMKFVRDIRCIESDRDQVTIVCGEEGSGKSLLSIALGISIDPDFTIKNVFFDKINFITAQLLMSTDGLDNLTPTQLELIDRYGIEFDKLEKGKGWLKKGSVISYDEAGTQLSSRQSMTKESVDQVNLFISNRNLRLFYLLSTPRPGSLDIYLRMDRSRMLLWNAADYNKHKKKFEYTLFGYTRTPLARMLCNRKWRPAFSDTSRLIRSFPPSFMVDLPDVRELIPDSLLIEYNLLKRAFNTSLMAKMLQKDKKRGASTIDDKSIVVDTQEKLKNIARKVVDGGERKTLSYLKTKYMLSDTEARHTREYILGSGGEE